MSHDTDPRKDALTPEERELARIARALPGQAPPPELDRRILDAARAAVDGASPHRRLGWRWGFGASAAALLVVAMVWPVLIPERAPIEGFSAPADGDAALAPPAAPPAPEPAAQAPAALRLERAAPLAEEPAVAADALRGRAAESREADAAARQAPTRTVAMPPVEEDIELAPEDWLARIRERLAADDDAGARRSLAAFVLRHPDHPVPDDLQRLAEE